MLLCIQSHDLKHRHCFSLLANMKFFSYLYNNQNYLVLLFRIDENNFSLSEGFTLSQRILPGNRSFVFNNPSFSPLKILVAITCQICIRWWTLDDFLMPQKPDVRANI